MDNHTQAALQRLTTWFDAQTTRLLDPDNYALEAEPPMSDWWLVLNDREAKRQMKASLGIQEAIGFAKRRR